MPRWIVFDQETFAQVRRQFPRENLFEHGAHNAVEYATDRQETVVAVLALGGHKHAGVAVFRHAAGNRLPRVVERTPVRESVDREARQVRAGGLLGLRDEDFYDEPPKAPRKQSWWRRFWPEED